MIIEILILLVLILISGVFSMAEIAVVSARKAILEDQIAKGNENARNALSLKENLNYFISTVQALITLMSVIIGAYVGIIFGPRLIGWFSQFEQISNLSSTLGYSLIILFSTFLVLLFGEFAPRQYALNRSERIATWVSPLILLLGKVLYPGIWLLNFLTDLLIRTLRMTPPSKPLVTEEEIKMILQEGAQAGVLEKQEHELVTSIFRFADRRVSNLMTPRSDIVWLNTLEPMEKTLRKIQECGHSRYPVCDGDLDLVVGIVSAKDIYHQLTQNQPVNLTQFARKPSFILEHVSGLQVHEVFREHGTHMALVVDEYGVIIGLVTVHDLVEAILGDLPEEEDPVELQVVQLEDGSWLMDGLLPIEDFKEIIAIDTLSEEDEHDYQTLAGMLLKHLGEFPKEGKYLELGEYRYQVVKMDRNRIDKVLVIPLSQEAQANENADEENA